MPSPRTPAPDLLALAKAIRHLRRERGLPQEALGAAAGLSGRHVSVIERAERDPRATTIVRLADALGVTLAELFGEAEEQSRNAADAREPKPGARPEPRATARPSHRYKRMNGDWPAGSLRSSSASTTPRG